MFWYLRKYTYPEVYLKKERAVRKIVFSISFIPSHNGRTVSNDIDI